MVLLSEKVTEMGSRRKLQSHPNSIKTSPAGSNRSWESNEVFRASSYDIPKYLVDVTVIILRAIRHDLTGGERIPFDSFLHQLIHNVFVLSKTSHSVLLASLLYLLRFRFMLPKRISKIKQTIDVHSPSLVYVLFLSSMTLSSKFHLDTTTQTSTWATTIGINEHLINKAECILLDVIEYRLAIQKTVFDDWVRLLFAPQNLHNYRRDHYNTGYDSSMNETEQSEHVADILLNFGKERDGITRIRVKDGPFH